jgi:hypothetical protein
MRANRHLVFFTLLLLAGCTSAQNQTSDPSQLPMGSNTIMGQARLLYPSGFVRDCADQTVLLLPATAEVTAQVTAAFGTAQGGSLQRYGLEIGADTPFQRKTECGSDGRFRFGAIPDGHYYVLARVLWLVRWQRNVVNLVLPVTVANGETASVELKKVF